MWKYWFFTRKSSRHWVFLWGSLKIAAGYARVLWQCGCISVHLKTVKHGFMNIPKQTTFVHFLTSAPVVLNPRRNVCGWWKHRYQPFSKEPCHSDEMGWGLMIHGSQKLPQTNVKIHIPKLLCPARHHFHGTWSCSARQYMPHKLKSLTMHVRILPWEKHTDPFGIVPLNGCFISWRFPKSWGYP